MRRPRKRPSLTGFDAEHGAGIRHACQPCLRTPISYVPGLNKSEAIQTWGLRLRLRLDRFAVARDDDRNRIHLRTTQGGRGGAAVLYCSPSHPRGSEPRHGNLSPADRSDRSRGRGGVDHAGRDGGVGPAEAGARMVVRASGGFYGTIGGGELEHQALEEARAALEPGAGRAPPLGRARAGARPVLRRPGRLAGRDLRPARSRRPRAARRGRAEGPFVALARLSEDGRVARRLGDAPEDGERGEAFGEAATPVYLFGAGHVGRALVLTLAPLPFAVRWIDPRRDEFPQLAPANVTLVAAADPPAELKAAPDGAFVLAITHSHQLDLAVVAEALRQDRFAYVGMIGSATKRARFVSQLRAAGNRRGADRQARLPDRLGRDRRQGTGGDRARRRCAIADGAGRAGDVTPIAIAILP